ncbi:CD1107 family mobile element protein [Butyrivibrio sp. INlla16]|uniref:CD1107 family mobile element protein n=1 Tax=Butyrivibrio sp. INlla16 TaxID=1520807 RepID=UPI000887C5D7|nr:DUF4366 domain-containing protein [Butyrivibrio sp. INlla16]SDB49792.1 protein of unknown function [Butyrivibrio sp. INlla16]
MKITETLKKVKEKVGKKQAAMAVAALVTVSVVAVSVVTGKGNTKTVDDVAGSISTEANSNVSQNITHDVLTKTDTDEAKDSDTGAETEAVTDDEKNNTDNTQADDADSASSDSSVGRDVVLNIVSPDGWYSDSAEVKFEVKNYTGDEAFRIMNARARIGSEGTYVDVLEPMAIEITENCSVYLEITDEQGNLYTKSKSIICFDKTLPTLRAGVSNGVLSVKASDTESGVKAIYVNNTIYDELSGGGVDIQLQQFDSYYKKFVITAEDYAGNISSEYSVNNPYYDDPDNSNDDDMKNSLPVSAETSGPTYARGTVTQHSSEYVDVDGAHSIPGTDSVDPDKDDDSTPDASSSSSDLNAQKKESMAKADAVEAAETGKTTDGTPSTGDGSGSSSYNASNSNTSGEEGKEFYTIETRSGKTFYMVIDKSKTDDNAYLLTEASEDDLMNFTGQDAQTLNQDSAVVSTALPSETKLPETTEVEKTETEEEEPEAEPEKKNSTGNYIMILLVFIGIIGGGFYFKVWKPQHDNPEFGDDGDEDGSEADDDFGDDNT